MRESLQLHVTPREQRQYDAAAAQCVRKAVTAHAHYRSGIPGPGWSLVRRQHHLAVYKTASNAIARDPRASVLCAIGRVPGTVSQVMDGLYSDTTESTRVVKTMVGYSLVDAKVLHVSESRSPELPFRFAGIKWFAAKAAWSFAGHRDVLSFERMGVTRDDDGNEFAYYVVSSIHRPEWPPNVMKGVRRQDTATCFLYRPLGASGYVECFGWCEAFELGSSRSARMAEYAIAGSLLSVEHAASISRSKRFSRLLTTSCLEKWPPSYLCHVCYDRPFLATHRQCAACLQSTCMSCMTRQQLFKLDAHTKRPMERRFCRLCVDSVLCPASDDEGVDFTSCNAVTHSHLERVVSDASSGVTTPSALGVNATRWSAAVAALAHPLEQPPELSALPPTTASTANCLADLSSMTRSTQQPKKLVSLRSNHRRGGSSRFPSASSTSSSAKATASGAYNFFRPLDEVLKPRTADSPQLGDLLLSAGSSNGARRRAGVKLSKKQHALTLDTINNSSVSSTRVSTTTFAPGLSQFELEVDLAAALRAEAARLGDDDDVMSVSDRDLRSLSPRHKAQQLKPVDAKDAFLADLYSLSLSFSPR